MGAVESRGPSRVLAGSQRRALQMRLSLAPGKTTPPIGDFDVNAGAISHQWNFCLRLDVYERDEQMARAPVVLDCHAAVWRWLGVYLSMAGGDVSEDLEQTRHEKNQPLHGAE